MVAEVRCIAFRSSGVELEVDYVRWRISEKRQSEYNPEI